MSLARVPTADERGGKDTAAFLRQLADRADAGEVVAVAGIALRPGGYYEVLNSPHVSRLQLIGALFDAAVTRTEP